MGIKHELFNHIPQRFTNLISFSVYPNNKYGTVHEGTRPIKMHSALVKLGNIGRAKKERSGNNNTWVSTP